MMDKIQMVDPLAKDGALAPMRSMEQMDRAGNTREKDTREKSVSEMVQAEVEGRMTKAAEELQAKYARGEGGRELSENGPTGAAYTAQHKAEADRRKDARARKEAAEFEKEMADAQREAEVRAQARKLNGDASDDEEGENPAGGDDEVDSDDEFLAELEGDDDPELARIRATRLNQIRAEQINLQNRQRAGYGTLTEIVQDEFLPRITKEARCVVHFYHNDFHRCSIMDHHLQIIAAKHPECLFLKINAEKAPFFCEKLNIMVLPTVIGFFEGKTNPNQRQIGFTDLKPATDERGNPKGEDEWPTSELEEKMGLIGVIDYVKEATQEELLKYGLLEKGSITASRHIVRGEDPDDF